jgi:hypothetical protein
MSQPNDNDLSGLVEELKVSWTSMAGRTGGGGGVCTQSGMSTRSGEKEVETVVSVEDGAGMMDESDGETLDEPIVP